MPPARTPPYFSFGMGTFVILVGLWDIAGSNTFGYALIAAGAVSIIRGAITSVKERKRRRIIDNILSSSKDEIPPSQ